MDAQLSTVPTGTTGIAVAEPVVERVIESGSTSGASRRACGGTAGKFKDAKGTVYYRARITLDSERVWLKPRFPTRREAKAYAAKKSAELNKNGVTILEVRQNDMRDAVTVAEYYPGVAHYRKYEKIRKNGRRGYTDADKDLKTFWLWIAPRFGKKRVADVTTEDVENFRDELDEISAQYLDSGRKAVRGESVCGKRCQNIFSVFVVMFKEATASKKKELHVFTYDADGARKRIRNPCDGVIRPIGSPKRIKTFVYPEEFERVCAAALAGLIPIQWWEAHTIACYSFLRPEELHELRKRDIDVERGVFKVRRVWDAINNKVRDFTKTDAGQRNVPIHENLRPLIERMCRPLGDDDLLLPFLRDAVAPAATTREHLWVAGARDARLHTTTTTDLKANFRSWRDTGITWSYIAGIEILQLMRWAGHTKREQTEDYIKQAEDWGSRIGKPFPKLPEALVNGLVTSNRPSGASKLAAPSHDLLENVLLPQFDQRDSNPQGVDHERLVSAVSTGNRMVEPAIGPQSGTPRAHLDAALGRTSPASNHGRSGSSGASSSASFSIFEDDFVTMFEPKADRGFRDQREMLRHVAECARALRATPCFFVAPIFGRVVDADLGLLAVA